MDRAGVSFRRTLDGVWFVSKAVSPPFVLLMNRYACIIGRLGQPVNPFQSAIYLLCQIDKITLQNEQVNGNLTQETACFETVGDHLWNTTKVPGMLS